MTERLLHTQGGERGGQGRRAAVGRGPGARGLPRVHHRGAAGGAGCGRGGGGQEGGPTEVGAGGRAGVVGVRAAPGP